MFMSRLIIAAIAGVLAVSSAMGFTFIDDFEDNDISDWEERAAPGNWSVSSGMVHGNTPTHPSLLVASEAPPAMNCTISVLAGGIHAFGICSRLDESNSGVIAYVSPDHDVARIRLVENGIQGTILNSYSHDFPSGVMYELTLSLEEEIATFLIEVPSTGDSWSFSATDPSPHAGSYGFHIGDEPGAYWDWIEVSGTAEGAAELTWFTTDDQSMGNGDMCLEPGETIQLSAELTNFSDYTLFNAFGILQSLSPYVEVTDNYVDYGDIAGMSPSYGYGSFGVFASPAASENEVYEMRLTVMADEGFLEQIYFSLPVGSGLSTDLESDSFGWSWSSAEAGWANDWHVSDQRNHTPGGQYSFKCGSTDSGDYSNHHFGYLETPYFNIPLDCDCTFWSWLDVQELSSSVALDGGMVQYRRMDDWIDLFPIPAYSHQITSGTTGPFQEGTPVYSGILDWTAFSIDFPDSLAGPGALRFLFGSDNSGNREGWYIDDFNAVSPGTGAEGSSVLMQQSFLQVSQNPFSEVVTFSCAVSSGASPSLEIRDLSGRLIEVLTIPGGESSGSMVWETTGIPSGIYFAKIAGSDNEPLKLVKF